MTLTLRSARSECRRLGFTLVKLDGEFIVKPIGARNDDSRAYFTNDLDDAVDTTHVMAMDS